MTDSTISGGAPANAMKPPNIFGTKLPSSMAFVVGVLLFLMPFAELKCSNKNSQSGGSFLELTTGTFFSNTGLGLAIGSNWKSALDGPRGLLETGDNLHDELSKQKPNMYALVALILAVLGAILSFLNNRGAVAIAMVSAGLGTAALIGLFFKLKRQANEANTGGIDGSASEWGMENFKDVSISLSFTPWFFVAVIALLAAAYFSYKRLTINQTG